MACVVGYSAFRPRDLFYQGTLAGGHKGLNDLYSREVEVCCQFYAICSPSVVQIYWSTLS